MGGGHVLVANTRPKKVILSPAPDGARTSFTTPEKYVQGSVSIWMNGLRLDREADNGFAELGGNTVHFFEAPLVGDTLQAVYDPE